MRRLRDVAVTSRPEWNVGASLEGANYTDIPLIPQYKTAKFGLFSDDLGFFHQLYHAPGLGTGQRAAFLDQDQVPQLALGRLVMGVVLARAGDVFAVEVVLHAPLHDDRDGLLHLVADHAAGQLTLVRRFAHALPC